MITGILGGAFDPIHSGHVAAAKAAMAALRLDRVLMLSSGDPPYKRCRADRADRMRMVELACEGQPGLVPCDLEARRESPTYTADTLRALKALWPEDELVYLIGADALPSLSHWRDIESAAALASFAVIERPGVPSPGAARLPGGVRMHATGICGPDISSGKVRRRVAEGGDIGALVPPAVGRFIQEKGLYLCDYSEAKILERLRRAITLHRYHHTLGVADTAERLAAGCGVDPMRARLAGLLHDCAKSLPYGEMRRLVEAGVPDADALELDAEPVLHAPAGMVLAQRDYGVRDPSILQAIRRHTLGGPAMTPMDALIYVSDFIEPGRRPFPGLEDVRAAAEADIFRAMAMSARLSSDYLISRGQSPHPRTLEMLSEYEQTKTTNQTGGEAK